jgi:hypothetical protein
MTPGNKDLIRPAQFISQAPTAGFQTLWVQRQRVNRHTTFSQGWFFIV